MLTARGVGLVLYNVLNIANEAVEETLVAVAEETALTISSMGTLLMGESDVAALSQPTPLENDRRCRWFPVVCTRTLTTDAHVYFSLLHIVSSHACIMLQFSCTLL